MPIFQQYVDGAAMTHRMHPGLKGGTMTDEDMIRQMRDMARDRGMVMDDETLSVELDWVQSGRPHYKLWPDMVHALASTEMSVPCEYMQLPYGAFTILVPVDEEFPWLTGRPRLRAILVGWSDSNHTQDSRDRTLHLNFQFDAEIPGQPGTLVERSCSLGLVSGKTLDWVLQKAVGLPMSGDDNLLTTKEIDPWLRIVVCTAFFGLGSHELVRPDLTRKKEDQYRRAVQSGDTERAESVLRQASDRGGHRVGSEVTLPRPRHVSPTDGKTSEGHQHTDAHVRRGRLCRQLVGSGKNPAYEIRFTPPAVVRPDEFDEEGQDGVTVNRGDDT